MSHTNAQPRLNHLQQSPELVKKLQDFSMAIANSGHIEQGLSHLADNVVLLQYVQEGPELARALTVLKTRAMHHHPVVHRYEITEKGFVLGDVLTLTR